MCCYNEDDWIVFFCLVFCCFFRFWISFSSSGVIRDIFFSTFFMTEKQIKNAHRPFQSCSFLVFGCSSERREYDELETVNFDLFAAAAAAAETLLSARADVRFTSTLHGEI